MNETIIAGRPPIRQVEAANVSLSGNTIAYATRIDDVGGGVKYIGKAAPGSATSSAAWQIMKLDKSASPDLTITWAGGSGNFTSIWDNRLSLSYS